MAGMVVPVIFSVQVFGLEWVPELSDSGCTCTTSEYAKCGTDCLFCSFFLPPLVSSYRQHLDPELVDEHHLSHEDQVIKTTDLPERLQLAKAATWMEIEVCKGLRSARVGTDNSSR